jgi:hypothetical protein
MIHLAQIVKNKSVTSSNSKQSSQFHFLAGISLRANLLNITASNICHRQLTAGSTASLTLNFLTEISIIEGNRQTLPRLFSICWFSQPSSFQWFHKATNQRRFCIIQSPATTTMLGRNTGRNVNKKHVVPTERRDGCGDPNDYQI